MASPTDSEMDYNADEYHRRHFMPLFDAVRNGDLDRTRRFLRNNSKAVESLNPHTGKTALHLAAMAGHTRIIEELMDFMSEDPEMESQRYDGFTLADAISYGIKDIVREMVIRNKKNLEIPTKEGLLPVALAFVRGYKDIGRFLYSETPTKALSLQEGTISGATVLTSTIRLREFDIALNLLRQFPYLAVAKDRWGDSPMLALARASFAFPSGNPLNLWQQVIYRVTPSRYLPPLIASMLSGTLRLMYEEKHIHSQSLELLRLICEFVKNLDDEQINSALVPEAIFEATDRGILEFITYFTKVNPELLWCTDYWGMNIFMRAIKSRQKEIYRYLCSLPSKEAMAAHVDMFGNNALHMAGLLAPYSKLHHISGAALQMQRELQWFKEIESIMLPHLSESKNIDMMTPRETFTTTHKDLMIDGEKWMKETASFCIVASALVVTIMFAAAITIPGGNDQESGFPIFLSEKLFRVFIFSNVLSVFSSTISVLEFLGIITSRYAEEDFLKALPTRMTLGVTFLLFSIATMLLAFITVIFIMFKEEPGIRIPISLLSIIPVIFFAWQIFPLLHEILLSTYGRIFPRKHSSYGG